MNDISNMNVSRSFPADFLWGAATSSYQIEGSWDQHDKGESIWDRFVRASGNILDASTGDHACDHYVRWQDDVALMKSLGLRSYRFSIAWPRILPDGTGKVNQSGLDFYSRLVDELLEQDIVPNATLYHWDLPQALAETNGGWPDRSIVEAFVDYTAIVTAHLGDRVKMWSTINEPWVIATLGYDWGIHAPGIKDHLMAASASHHVLLAHGRAVPIIRENSPGAAVGIVLNLSPQHPASAEPGDVTAARLADGFLNRWYLDPLAGFGYPQDIVATYDGAFDAVHPGDMQAIATPLDYLGINYYSRRVSGAEQNEPGDEPDTEVTEMGWEVYPHGLYETLARVYFHYGFPRLYVTENGAAYADELSSDGRVHDHDRVSYYARHLHEALDAIEAGIPLEGYYAWSLMDNFEWAMGLSKRFGIVHVDYETQERTLKDSAYFYRDVIAANGLPAIS